MHAGVGGRIQFLKVFLFNFNFMSNGESVPAGMDDDFASTFAAAIASSEAASSAASTASASAVGALRLVAILFAHAGARFTSARLVRLTALLRTLSELPASEQRLMQRSAESASLWAFGVFIGALLAAEPRMHRAEPPRPLVCEGAGDDFRAQRLYVVGDSHALSFAWRRIKVRGLDASTLILAPWLIPGLKAFHVAAAVAEPPASSTAVGARGRALRSALHRIAFEQTTGPGVRGIVDVIVSAGEIDTREGIAGAVRKGVYADHAEGGRATAASYVAALGALASSAPRLRILVLPVPPHAARPKRAGRYRARARRRECTEHFNDALRRSIAAADDAAVVLLDIDSELHNPNPTASKTSTVALDPRLRCDGTHMNAAVVSILERALRRARSVGS